LFLNVTCSKTGLSGICAMYIGVSLVWNRKTFGTVSFEVSMVYGIGEVPANW